MQGNGLHELEDAIHDVLSSQRGKEDVKHVRFACEYDDDPAGGQPWMLVAFEGGESIAPDESKGAVIAQ